MFFIATLFREEKGLVELHSHCWKTSHDCSISLIIKDLFVCFYLFNVIVIDHMCLGISLFLLYCTVSGNISFGIYPHDSPYCIGINRLPPFTSNCINLGLFINLAMCLSILFDFSFKKTKQTKSKKTKPKNLSALSLHCLHFSHLTLIIAAS